MGDEPIVSVLFFRQTRIGYGLGNYPLDYRISKPSLSSYLYLIIDYR